MSRAPGTSLTRPAAGKAIVDGIKGAVGVTQSGAPLLEFVLKEGRDFSRYPLGGL
jgi:hypothetical protein